MKHINLPRSLRDHWAHFCGRTVGAPKPPQIGCFYHRDGYSAPAGLQRQHGNTRTQLTQGGKSVAWVAPREFPNSGITVRLAAHRLGNSITPPNPPITVETYADAAKDAHHPPHGPDLYPYRITQFNDPGITDVPLFAEGPMQSGGGFVPELTYEDSEWGPAQTAADQAAFHKARPDVQLQQSELDVPGLHWKDLPGAPAWRSLFDHKVTNPQERGVVAGANFDEETNGTPAERAKVIRRFAMYSMLYYGGMARNGITDYELLACELAALKDPITADELAEMQDAVRLGKVHPDAPAIVASIAAFMAKGVQIPMSALYARNSTMNYETPTSTIDAYADMMTIKDGPAKRDGKLCTFPGYIPDANNFDPKALHFNDAAKTPVQGIMVFPNGGETNNPHFANPHWLPDAEKALGLTDNPDQVFDIRLSDLAAALKTQQSERIVQKTRATGWRRFIPWVGRTRKTAWRVIPMDPLREAGKLRDPTGETTSRLRGCQFLVPESWATRVM